MELTDERNWNAGKKSDGKKIKKEKEIKEIDIESTLYIPIYLANHKFMLSQFTPDC